MMRRLLKRSKSNKVDVNDQQASVLIAREGAVRGHADLYDGNNIFGWAAREDGAEPVTVDVHVNDRQYTTVVAKEYREDLKHAGIGSGCSGFTCSIRVQDLLNEFGSEPEIRVYAQGSELVGSKFKVAKENVRHSVDVFKDGVCAGWIVDLNNPHTQLDLDIYIDDEKVGSSRAGFLREDLSVLDLPNLYHGFHIDFSSYTDKEVYRARVELKYNASILLAEEKTFCSFHSKVNSLVQLQKYLRAQGYDKETIMGRQLIHGVLPALIDKVRAEGELEYEIAEYCSGKAYDRIAVIIPVYKGIEETCNCIESVVGSKNRTDYRLLVINDCGPEEGMLPALEGLQKKYGFELYNNEENLGFVGTVNRGMRESDGCDVVLLNSDTVVPEGWLDAIRSEAYEQVGSDQVGTVTPISNNATICSFPKFCVDNEIPNGFSVEEIARHCAENERAAVDMPTAHGYCMFIKRDALREVGYFDEQKWGKGYAEENDFSLRASKLGWRHVVTNKTFVHHLGSVSFAEDSAQFIANNLDKLNGIYPDYPKLVETFVREDPVAVLRKETAMRLMIAESKKLEFSAPAKGRSILFVSLSIGGGTKVATDDLSSLLNKEGQSVYMLTSPDPGVWRVESQQSDLFSDFSREDAYDDLLDFLRDLGVWHIHFHHTLQFPKTVWGLSDDLGVEYDVTLHDYYSVCPRVNFIGDDDFYCGEKGEKDCEDCIKKNGVHSASVIDLKDVGGTVSSWRLFHEGRLNRARKVFTPSEDTKERISRYLDVECIGAAYHPEPVEKITPVDIDLSGEVNVAFIGAIGPHKGFNVLRDCAEFAASNGLPIKFIVIGYTCSDEELASYSNVKVIGRYGRGELQGLLKRHQCHMAALLSVWPETYSYTFSESVRAGLYPLSFDFGAIKERIDLVGWGSKLALDSTPRDICDEILRARENTAVNYDRNIGVKYGSIISDYYGF